MTSPRQTLLISALAVAGFFGLRALPDTQCAFLHADHQPVVVDGVEFCGVNEEANFYSPKALQFPVQLKLDLSADGAKGELRLIKDDGQPYLAHEIAISHTQRCTCICANLQVPVPTLTCILYRRKMGRGASMCLQRSVASPGGICRLCGRPTSRVMLAQAELKVVSAFDAFVVPARNTIVSMEASATKAGTSATLRVKLAGPEGRPLKLLPIMGSLGHAVVFSVDNPSAGYAHMHPTLEGGEYAPNPTLSFRLRLPPPGKYDLWLNLNDGQEELLRTTLVVTP